MLRQMSLLQNGDLTADELEAARLSTLASLYSIEDSPYALENYYQSLSAAGLSRPLNVLMEDVKAVTLDEVVQAAQRTQPEFVYFLKGAAQ